MMERQGDNEIIQEATEAVEKNLNAGYYVGELLRIVKEQQAEIERLKCSAIRNGKQIGSLIHHLETAQSEAYREFAEKAYRFFCNKENWNAFKEAWLENGECYWLKQSLDKLAKGLTESNDRDR